ncbi:RNA polymerase sporulation-specific sigma factor [Propionispira arboris]|uniref:RNA polymerase sporulation-specific sigma factor n=1 Tax=Propionispira arboris TaxID=84035 RepID=A0A1H6TYR1_9FIRM|nr:sigma-70 family RNA polymerase sigma factor [Propionispira arboris]SEI82387.1 RNA polymerase sporulation-specific sigma factor [Propionispira arboris]
MELQEYLQELKKIEILDLPREMELWSECKIKQNMDARRILIESYQPLVFKAAMQFSRLSNIMDIIQEGTVGLIEAVEKYDHERGVAFSLYALHRIRGRMLNYIKKENSFDFVYNENTVSADGMETFNIENIVDNAASVMQQAETNFLVDELKSALERLPQKEQMVLSSVYLDNQEPREVAQALSVSTTHVYRLQKAGIRRVRGMLSKLMQQWR